MSTPEPTADEAFETFCKHWKARAPEYHMDDEKSRDAVMSLVSSSMVLLLKCPEVFDEFLKRTARVMEQLVPNEVKKEMEAL